MQIMLDMHMHRMQIVAMTFDEFLTSNKITDAEASEKLGRDQSLIGRYRRRYISPSPEIMVKIVEWSLGAITPRELLADKRKETA